MARVRGEYLRLGKGADYGGGGWPGMVEGKPYGSFTIEVTETALGGEDRQVVPEFDEYDRGHVRLICDAICIVVIGEDPTASASDQTGYLLMPDVPEVLPVNSGELISLVTATTY